MPRSRTPEASRPHMPGYGILPASAGGGLLPWEWAVERLQRAHNYWVATCRADQSPHLAAVWGVWHADAFWFSTGARSRKAINLALDGRCSIAPEHAADSVVVEGIASRIVEPATLATVSELYVQKYGEGFPDPEVNPVYRVDPHKVFGIIETEPGFSGRATRWIFSTAP